jgi:hypothetical protein
VKQSLRSRNIEIITIWAEWTVNQKREIKISEEGTLHRCNSDLGGQGIIAIKTRSLLMW